MSPSDNSAPILTLMLILLAAFTSNCAWGQTTDKTATDLARARVKYESEITSLCGQVETSLFRARDNAPKAKDPESARKEATDQIEAFLASGKLPGDKAKSRWKKAYGKANADLVKAFVIASTGYAKASRDELEEAINVESELFRGAWDLLPWQTKLKKDTPASEKAITPDSTPLNLQIDMPDDFRLEVRATRVSDSGTLKIEVPLADAIRLVVPADTDAKGAVRVLLTIRGGRVSPDLGTPRPVSLSGAAPGESSNIVISSSDGSFQVESVNVKPVIDGIAPPSPGVADQPKRAKDGANDPEQLVPKGSKWSGEFQNRAGGHNSEATVLSQSDSRVVFRIATGDYGTRDWEFSIRGNSLVLNECRIVRTKYNNTLKEIDVSGTVKDGELSVSGKWIYQGGRGGTESISLVLRKQ